jgi:hypothetical protein
MPCLNPFEPAKGCLGPGSLTACAFCVTRPKPKPPMPPKPLNPQLAARLLAQTPVPKQVPVLKPAVILCKKLPTPPPDQLTSLDVARACGGPGSWWQVVSADQTVEVKATTRPNRSAVWGKLDWGANVKQVSRAAVGTQTITCQLNADPPKSVTIDIYDLTSLSISGTAVSGAIAKVYESAGEELTITAATDPDASKVWDLIQWGGRVTAGGAALGVSRPAATNEVKVDLSQARDVQVQATLGCSPALGQRTIETTVHVCKWPVLEVQQVEFTNSHPVYNDGVTEIDKQFDKKWVKGRPDPATGCVTASTQSPLCYTGGTPITLSVEFNVTQKPTDDEHVWVAGLANYGGLKLEWKQQIAVGKADTKVNMAGVTSGALPPGVAMDKKFTIDWFMTEHDNTTWRKIGTTTHLLYQTLRAPTARAYWTLLDISCEAGDGKTTENAFVDASFVPFTKHVGDNKGFPRKGDGLKLSYYKTGYKTAADDTTWTPGGMLGSSEATGRCGGWAEVLIHMWNIHGVTSNKRWFVRSVSDKVYDMDQRFLVKRIDFSTKPNLKNSLYTHRGHQSLKQDGVAGQGKNNPQFDFGDHVVVKHGGRLFDPSYGVGPEPDDKSYLTKALDGLGSWENGNAAWVMADGTTHQHIPAECVPYNKGFADYRIGPETLHHVADRYNVTAQQLLDWDPVLKGLRGSVDKVRPGDVVVIPTNPRRSVTLTTGITFDKIAAAHGLTKKKIFDHKRNKAVKKLRKQPDAVGDGDHIIVSWELLRDGVWVIGHDQ